MMRSKKQWNSWATLQATPDYSGESSAYEELSEILPSGGTLFSMVVPTLWATLPWKVPTIFGIWKAIKTWLFNWDFILQMKWFVRMSLRERRRHQSDKRQSSPQKQWGWQTSKKESSLVLGRVKVKDERGTFRIAKFCFYNLKGSSHGWSFLSGVPQWADIGWFQKHPGSLIEPLGFQVLSYGF